MFTVIVSAQERPAVVAGSFYPASEAALRQSLDQLFTAADDQHDDGLRALIVPHAGYIFSGKVAARGYAAINPKKSYKNIFLIGPSHRARIDGASLYAGDHYTTPLGKVPVNSDIVDKLIEKHSFFHFRPRAHLNEHCLEVQIPFLQHRLNAFKIIPILIGTQDEKRCRQIAEALRPYFTPDNLFIISSDFSHYPGYEAANEADRNTADALCTNDPRKFQQALAHNAIKSIPNLHTSCCGQAAVLTLMYLTRNNARLHYNPIAYANSGDAQPYGNKNRVVGYWAIAVTETAQESAFFLTENDKTALLEIARNTLQSYIIKQKVPSVRGDELSDKLKTPLGAFVSLYKEGQLRGCIGRFLPKESLYKVVQDMTIAAATQDHRFSPVTAGELSKLEIEISVLTPLKKISSVDEIEPGRHGIYIMKGNRGGTFLPQVAAKTGWSRNEFLGHCARDKAGLGWNGWKDADIYTYEAIVFTSAKK